jgi:hypothetical protein
VAAEVAFHLALLVGAGNLFLLVFFSYEFNF